MKFVSAGKEYTSYREAISAPLFRLGFTLAEKKKGAFLKIASLGFYRAFINGKEITKGLLAPYISNPYHYNYYDRYELDRYLNEGENVLSVLLANGFRNDEGGQIWDFDKAPFRGVPAIALNLFDGERTYTAEDTLWKRSALLYDDYRCGVIFDARLWKEEELFPGASLDESEWHAPTPVDGEPLGELRECTAEPIRVYDAVDPVDIIPESGIVFRTRSDVYKGELFLEADDASEGYLYDFGINTAGTARLRIKGKAAQRISLRFGELRDGNSLDLKNINFQPEGYVQRAIYILKGGEEEIFEIPFTYFGYRYCHVHGITPEQATASLLTMLPACSDIKRRVDFSTSDPTVNRIYSMVRNSDLSNFHYFPNDCPQREKNGWTGDASESAERMLLFYGAEHSFDQWYDSIIAAQDERGAFPGIVPTGGWGFDWGNGPSWDRVIVNLPYYVYKYTGKTDMIRRGADAMMRYLRYIAARRNSDGTIEIGLGDYCQTGRPADKPTTPIVFTDTVVSKDIAEKVAYLLSLIDGNPEDIEYARGLSESFRAAARAAFLDESDCSLAGGTQTAQGFGIAYGIFDDEEKPRAAARLAEEIERDGFHMNFGFLGSRVVFHVLSDYGYADLAYKMIMQETEPSYAYAAKQGFTSMPERFSTKSMPITHCSFNHHFHNDVGQWFFRNILGINVNPGMDDPNAVIISPCLIEELTHAEGKRSMPGGELSLYWVRSGSTVDLTVAFTGKVRVDFDKKDCEMEIIDKQDGIITVKFTNINKGI